MSTLNEEVVHNLIRALNVPLMFKGYVNWPITRWNLDKWCSVFENRELSFRCLKKDIVSDEPCWERKCKVRSMKFKDFVDNSMSSEEWMYFDYKYMHKWFNSDTELYKAINWNQFGFDKGAADTTLWVGSSGAHTPAHQDTYGFNIVTQLYGRKRWIFFPPETGGLKSTRIPYEESSVYSELNFYCPNDVGAFTGLTGGRIVELSAGDSLFVPRGWWHYVQNLEPINIAANIWIPHEKDVSARVSEALIKIFVAQICKDLPEETAKLLLNPNEEDIADTPLTVLFLQLDTVANIYLENKRKTRRIKRQKTVEDSQKSPDKDDFDSKAILENSSNDLQLAPPMTSNELIDILKSNIEKYTSGGSTSDDEVDGSTASLCLTKALIDAFSQGNVIDIVKQNLFTRLSLL